MSFVGRIVIGGEDEEHQLITLFANGEAIEISNTSHDEHGWNGMEAARDAVERIATALYIPVVVDR